MTGETFAWTDGEVRDALGLSSDGVAPRRYTGVATDSRRPGAESLFVALQGPRFDGHDFVADAEAGGARGAVVSRAVEASPDTVVYQVPDTLVALGRLARHRRDALGAAVVGIGGSVGKTSTKELTAAALRASRRVHATRANENNRIGVPLTLLAAPADAEAVVVEMGTSEPGEIEALTAIARPDVAVLVTVGEEHLEGLGSRDQAIDEELDLLRGLSAGAKVIVGDTPPDLPERARRIVPDLRVAGWTERADHDLRPRDVAVDGEGHHTFSWQGQRVRLGIAGRHVVVNALLALAVADEVGVEASLAADALAAVRPHGMRGEQRRIGALRLVLDCYNANPQSVVAALDLIEQREEGARKVAVLGSMLELGARSEALHREVLSDALGRGLDIVVATGAFARSDGAPEAGLPELIRAEDPAVAYEALRSRLHGDEVVLLKGSRGVALERLVPFFEADFGASEVA